MCITVSSQLMRPLKCTQFGGDLGQTWKKWLYLQVLYNFILWGPSSFDPSKYSISMVFNHIPCNFRKSQEMLCYRNTKKLTRSGPFILLSPIYLYFFYGLQSHSLEPFFPNHFFKFRKSQEMLCHRNTKNLIRNKLSYGPYMYTLSMVFNHIPWKLSAHTTAVNDEINI